MKFFHDKTHKALTSKNYNFIFNKETGHFIRWGKTIDDDPDFAPFGPELADIEISTSCHGVTGPNGISIPCHFCYKSNTPKGTYMSLDTFKEVFSKFPPVLGQIAFGLGDIDSNPDIWDIFRHCRDHGVIPNITINGDRLTQSDITNLAELCGAVAVSRYNPKDLCYDAVQALTEAGLKSVNIHQLLASETYTDCMQALEDIKTDPRLANMNAIVFLALKQQGRGSTMTPLHSVRRYKNLISHALQMEVSFGFDSCSAPMFLKAMEGSRRYKEYETLAEPCESNLFSLFVDVTGKTVPCSFLEGIEEPIDLLQCTNSKDFLNNVWNGSEVNAWRERLLATASFPNALVTGCRQCPVFDIYEKNS